MITNVFQVKCLTNLHVGNGDVNFNIIDNEVERDPVTGYATIHSSGVKGALRSHFVHNHVAVEEIFGGEGAGKAGAIKFLSANLLAIPMRASKGAAPFYMVTTGRMIDDFNALCKSFGVDLQLSGKTTQTAEQVEGLNADATDALTEPFGIPHALVLSDEAFRSVSLPVIARNHLENGRSQFLWYEEIVPHETVFYFLAVANDDKKAALDDLTKTLDGAVVQFGGNATVGYGLCEVTLVGGGTK